MSSTGITSPVQGAINNAQGRGGQIVQIINLPNALQQSATAQRLEGQVTSQNTSNNTVNIQTERGNVEVKISGGRQPEIGQRVQIEIPANTREGQQPRNATIRNGTPSAQASSSQNATPQTSPNVNPSSVNTNTPTQSQAQTPPPQTRNVAPQSLPPALQETLAPRADQITQAPPRALTPNDTVRLIAVPPSQAQAIAQNYLATLPTPTATNIAQNVIQNGATAQDDFYQNTTLKPALQITPSTPAIQNILQQNLTASAFQTTQPPSTNILLSQNASNIFSAPPATSISTASTQQTFLPLNAVTNIAQPLQSTQTLPISSTISPALNTPPATPQQTIQNTTLVPTPITFDPANPTLSTAPRVGQIDIQIVQITPPNASLQLTTPQNLQATQSVPATTQFAQPIVGINNSPTLNAQVTGFTQQGLPLVTVQGINGRLPQSFILQQAAPNLQLGSQLQIIPKNAVPLATQNAATLNNQAAINPLLRGFQWPALDQLMTTLQQLSPQAASSLTRALPNAAQPSQLAANAMVFIAAVKSGNFDMLLGDKKIDMLQQAGRRSILSGLTQDTARAGTADSAIQSDWRAVPLPMFWDNEIYQITLYTRSEQQEQNSDDDGHSKTRFVFDLNLTRMGDVQIDGLIRDKRLDLIIRTQNAFSEPMQQTMRQAYSGALSQTELSGEITFQGSMHNRVHVLEKEAQLGVSI